MFGGDDFFDGMFDLDGDGMTDLGEQFLPFMIFQDMMHDDEDEDDWLSDALDDDADADAYIWISVCSIRLFRMRWRSSMPRRKRRNDSVAIPCPMCLKSRAGAVKRRTAAAKRRTAPGRMTAISCTRMISTIGIGTTLRISRKPRITITVTAAGDFGCCGKFYRDSTGGRLCMAAHTCILKPKEGCG